MMTAPLITTGRLRERLDVQEPRTTQNELGEELTTWHTIARPWAEVIPLGAAESNRGNRVQAEITYRVTLRYTRSFPLTAVHRFVRKDGTVLGIASVIDVQSRQIAWECICQEEA